MHDLPIDHNLISPDTIPLNIRRIGAGGYLDFAPLAIRWHELTGRCSLLELGIDTLILDAAFPLDEGRFYLEC